MLRRTSLAIGGALWLGATALLLEDAWRSGHLTVSHALMPVLTAGTIGAAVNFHHSLARLRIFSAAGFLLLAALGSLATVYGTMGRQAEARDGRAASAEAANRTLRLREQALGSARKALADAEAEVARECKTGFGRSCAGWRQTADERRAEMRRIEADLSTMSAAPIDARADAAVRLAVLLGVSDEAWLRALVAALDPVLLPAWLELGSIVFFAAGFPAGGDGAPRESVSEDERDDSEDEDGVSMSREEALGDLRRLIAAGAVTDGRMLARRWNVSETTVSRWQASWQRQGLIGRARDGRSRRPTAAA